MKLTPRLLTIAKQVKQGAKVADVGTDHGYIPIWLVENGICDRVIASDINEGPTDNARKAIAAEGYTGQIEARLGGGLMPYEMGEVDTVIIAGMGGLLIADILSERPEMTASVNTFILQPMQAQKELRKWLHEHDFYIKSEHLSREGNRIYEILVVEHGPQNVEDDLRYEIGIDMLKSGDPLSIFFLEKKIKQFKTIIQGLEYSKGDDVAVKKTALEHKLEQLEVMLTCLQTDER